MPEKNLQIRLSLLRWYDRNRRDLPWRRARDPYAVWIAETMLQQTQVKTALPYYERFLKTFPTLAALDRARLGRVLALWSGLGYYRRAEKLKKAARIVMREHRGRLPRDFESLRALPGIGRYTAGALMSIAFDRPFPALDGNARRVLGRLFGHDNDKDLWDAAGRLAAAPRPGCLNQALMELGATVCSPRAPRCPRCPLAVHCAARASGAAPAVSATRSTRRPKRVDWPLAIVRDRQRILLRRRGAGGILARLWELPGGERKPRESLRAALKRHLPDLGEAFGPERRIGELRHGITHRNIRAPVFLFDLPAGRLTSLPGREWRWLPLASLRRHPVSSMTLKAAKVFASHEKTFL